MILNGTAVENNTTLRAQYCVIGSGMGGASVASSLAKAGKDGLLVEAGGGGRSSSPPVSAEITGRAFGLPNGPSIAPPQRSKKNMGDFGEGQRPPQSPPSLLGSDLLILLLFYFKKG